MKRRSFLKGAALMPAVFSAAQPSAAATPQETIELPRGSYRPGNIVNEYSKYLPGEKEALRNSPQVISFANLREGEPESRPSATWEVSARLGSESRTLKLGESIGGWQLVAILPFQNGFPTAVFEKHATYQGAIAYVAERGEVANIPKRIGDLSKIRPRPTSTPHGIKFERLERFDLGPDVLGNYILNSPEDPRYENVAALGAEFIGWTLVANGETGPDKSLWLRADGTSVQYTDDRKHPAPVFEPQMHVPSCYLYQYVPGYSKRTLLGGYLPVADIGVWNPKFQRGYEVMMLLPPGKESEPMARVRATPLAPKGVPMPTGFGHENMLTPASGEPSEAYWQCSAESFFSNLLGTWDKWHHFFEDNMKVDIPDEWLLDCARAGIVLSRCSYRGLEPSYQVGAGPYVMVPERSHALFQPAFDMFVWCHHSWNLTEEVEPYLQHYLDQYILPDGNFAYNRDDQVEAPLHAGVFLEISARAYDYTHDVDTLRTRLPVLRRIKEYVLKRYRYGKETFPPDDPRYGLIWGSPEADDGDPRDDSPEAHPYYYQNASWMWRGLQEHARCLDLAGNEHQDDDLRREAAEAAHLATQMRAEIQRSLDKTLAGRNPEMKAARITPFYPFDTTRKPVQLSSYENHRFMMDWWSSDWGDPELDAGHFRHRELAGMQLLGMNTDGYIQRPVCDFVYGTLAGRIRQEDYRPFLLALYGYACYAMDSGNRYACEDSLMPGGSADDTPSYFSTAIVPCELGPALGLRWLLCYEEHDRSVVHLQKAAPKHWFTPGEKIQVAKCPTRFGHISWTTQAEAGPENRPRWTVTIEFAKPYNADLLVHIHPPDRQPLRSTSIGNLQKDRVVLPASVLEGKFRVSLDIT